MATERDRVVREQEGEAKPFLAEAWHEKDRRAELPRPVGKLACLRLRSSLTIHHMCNCMPRIEKIQVTLKSY
jgi:hypothetical protein